MPPRHPRAPCATHVCADPVHAAGTHVHRFRTEGRTREPRNQVSGVRPSASPMSGTCVIPVDHERGRRGRQDPAYINTARSAVVERNLAIPRLARAVSTSATSADRHLTVVEHRANALFTNDHEAGAGRAPILCPGGDSRSRLRASVHATSNTNKLHAQLTTPALANDGGLTNGRCRSRSAVPCAPGDRPPT